MGARRCPKSELQERSGASLGDDSKTMNSIIIENAVRNLGPALSVVRKTHDADLPRSTLKEHAPCRELIPQHPRVGLTGSVFPLI